MKGCLGCLVILAFSVVTVTVGTAMWRHMYPAEAARHDAENAKADRDAAAKRALEARDPKSGHEARICRRVQELVKVMLKAPSTSDFPSCVWNDDVHYAGDGHYNFSSYVDAQNSFGAKIRTYYDGEALVEGQDRAHLTYRFTRLDLNDGTQSRATTSADATQSTETAPRRAAQPEQSAQPTSAGPQLQACDAVKQAILADLAAPASSTFGPCDADDSSTPGDYTVAVAINIPHVDENGVSKPDTFYYANAKLDPATHEMKAFSLVHN